MLNSICVLHSIADIKKSAGGSRRSVVSNCAALAASGAHVHLVTQYRPSSTNARNLAHPDGVQTHLVKLLLDSEKLRVQYSPFLGRKLVELCQRECIQIIHDHGLWLPCNHTTARVANHLRIPLVIHPRGNLQPWALAYRSWKKRLAWSVYQRRDIETAALIVATSVQEADSIRKLGLRQPIAIIPNGIRLPVWRERTPRNTNERYALFLSRIHPSKGLLNLVTAWASVLPKGWKMIVAGPDEIKHRGEVERAIKNAKIQNDFEFVGPVGGAAKTLLYSAADLFILPTFSENFGIVVAEALSYGVPVITTHGAPWASLVKESCGWWVEVGPEHLANAISEAVSLSDTERYEMGRRGRKLVETEFPLELVTAKILSAYQWILGLGPKPTCIVD